MSKKMSKKCASRDRIEFEGQVISSNKDRFVVQVNSTYNVTCTLSGKIRQNVVRIINGDKVKIEVSEYDPTMGRIIYRLR